MYELHDSTISLTPLPVNTTQKYVMQLEWTPSKKTHTNSQFASEP